MSNQKFRNWYQCWKQEILKLEKPGFLLVAAALCLSIFGLGVWLGASSFDSGKNNENVNKAERLKIAIPAISGIIGTGFFLLFVNEYVFGHIEKYRKQYEYEKETYKKQCDAEKIISPIKVSKELRENQDLDFLSELYNLDYKNLNKINFKGFGESIDELRRNGSNEDLVKKIKTYQQSFKDRQEALSGLSKGFIPFPGKLFSPFDKLIVESCNQAVGISKDETSLKAFYSNMRVYLKAWLWCSIKHGVAIPVRLSIQDSLVHFRNSSGQQTSLSITLESYKKAITFIKEKALSDESMEPFLPTEGSRCVFETYFDDLILLLETDRTLSTITPNSSEESTGIR